MADVSRGKDESFGVGLGHGVADFIRQTEIEVLGKGLMCYRQESD